MRPGTAAFLALAGVPVAALLVLAGLGAAQPGAAAVTAGVVAAAAAGLAWLFGGDVARLHLALRTAMARDLPALAEAAQAPRLPPMAAIGRAIEQLARRLSQRAAQVERLRGADEAIVRHLPDPLVVLAADRSVRRANAAAQAAYGADLGVVLRHPGLRGAIDRALATGTAQVAALHLALPTPREVAATVIALDPPLPEVGALLLVLSDRTRDRALERMRADFVANASHELRTPLTSLVGFIDTLRGPAADDPPAQTRFLGIMAEQAGRMNRLIDDLLSLSRIEISEHQPPAERVELAELIPAAAAAFELRVAERGSTLAIELDGSLPAVTGDEDQLTQVLSNLLDNAVKYGREGGTVRVRAHPAAIEDAASGLWPPGPGVVVSVEDDGAGIPRAHLPRLTERFYRVDAGRSRVLGGTGLGLAIVKHIVNRHRGRLRIDSTEGAGTAVRLWLPQAR